MGERADRQQSEYQAKHKRSAAERGAVAGSVVSLVVFAPLDVLAMVPVALIIAQLVAALPGRAATRVRPALALRAE